MSATLVHQATGTSASGTSLVVTITAPTNGNVLMVAFAIASRTSARTVSSIAATGTSGWAHGPFDTPNGLLVQGLWFGSVGAGAGTSVTITISGTNNGSCANVSEWSGMVSPGTSDGSQGSGSGTSTAPANNPAYTTLTANDLVIAYETDANGTVPTVQPSGWTPLTFVGVAANCGIQANYRSIAAAATNNTGASWTISPSAAWTTNNWEMQQTAAPAGSWLKENYWWQRATDSSGVF